MATYLSTVREAWSDAKGITLLDGMRLSQFTLLPNNFMQGVVLELRLPDGAKHRTFLLNYGAAVILGDNGAVLMEEDPFVRATLPADFRPEDIPAGTAVWWIEEETGKSDEEMRILLDAYFSKQ